MSEISMKPTISKSKRSKTEQEFILKNCTIVLWINTFKSLLGTCADCSGYGLNLLVNHNRLRSRKDLNIWRQVPTVQDSMEGRVSMVNQLPKERQRHIMSECSSVNIENVKTNKWLNTGCEELYPNIACTLFIQSGPSTVKICPSPPLRRRSSSRLSMASDICNWNNTHAGGCNWMVLDSVVRVD